MKVTLKINNQDIEAEIKDSDVAKIVEKPKKKIRPEVGDTYYLLYTDGDVCDGVCGGVCGGVWNNDSFAGNAWNAGNGFFTREEAEKESAKLQAIQRIKDYIVEHDMEFEPDWSDTNQWKYFPYYDESMQIMRWGSCLHHRYYLPFSYLGSKEYIVQLIDNCKDDLVIIFDKK